MLSKAAQAVCIASLCLAVTTSSTTTTTEAFLVPPVALKSAAATRGHRLQPQHQHRSGVSCVRCNSNTKVATTMKGGRLDGYPDQSSSGYDYSNKLSALRHRLLSRTRGSSTEGEVVAAGEEVSVRARVQRRARAVMRKSFMAVATAVIVRASFNPQAASAVGYKPRTGGVSTSRQVQQLLQ